MTTKSIECVLRKMGLESKEPRTDEAVALALNELAAVRKAARTLDGCGITFVDSRRYVDQHDAVMMRDAIAKEES